MRPYAGSGAQALSALRTLPHGSRTNYWADAFLAVAGTASIILSKSSLSMTCDHMG
jgi:hypothetical protein